MLYRELQPATCRVYHFILERKNHTTQKFFWKIKKIAEEAGVSYSSVQRAEKELESAGIIEFVKRLPRAKEYLFVKKILLDESDQSSMTNVIGHSRPVRSVTGDQCTEQHLLTKTINNSTDKDLQSYNYLVKKFTKEVVDVAVVYCKKYNGEARNFWGLVHWSCQTGIKPTNKSSLQAEAKEKHIKFVEEQTEKVRAEREQWEKAQENADPELANNIIADFLKGHND